MPIRLYEQFSGSHSTIYGSSTPRLVEPNMARVTNVIGIATLLNRANGVRCITAMNARYKEIADYPFDYVDPFYQLHGSHRRRKAYLWEHVEQPLMHHIILEVVRQAPAVPTGWRTAAAFQQGRRFRCYLLCISSRAQKTRAAPATPCNNP
jgi:hypothetical protein